MRIAAGLIFAGAVSLCVSGAAWSQTPAPKSNAAPAATAAAPMPAAAPAQAKAPCANPDALGIGRVVEIDTTGGPGFGFDRRRIRGVPGGGCEGRARSGVCGV